MTGERRINDGKLAEPSGIDDLLAAGQEVEDLLQCEASIKTATDLLADRRLHLEADVRQLILDRPAKPENLRQRLAGISVARWVRREQDCLYEASATFGRKHRGNLVDITVQNCQVAVTDPYSNKLLNLSVLYGAKRTIIAVELMLSKSSGIQQPFPEVSHLLKITNEGNLDAFHKLTRSCKLAISFPAGGQDPRLTLRYYLMDQKKPVTRKFACLRSENQFRSNTLDLSDGLPLSLPYSFPSESLVRLVDESLNLIPRYP